MKTFSKLMMAVGFAMGLGLSGVANANTTIPIIFNGAYPTFGVNSGDQGAAVKGSFTDLFTFNLPSAAIPSIDGITGTLSSGHNVNFSSLSLYDVSTASTVATGSVSSNSCGSSCAWQVTYFLPTLVNLLSNSYEFIVTGTGTGSYPSYALNASITAVPEPETYAMLLAGLGLLLFTARSRKNNDLGGDFT